MSAIFDEAEEVLTGHCDKVGRSAARGSRLSSGWALSAGGSR
jgi:hypothetical protein